MTTNGKRIFWEVVAIIVTFAMLCFLFPFAIYEQIRLERE
jgi:hypothetical protein